MEILRHNGELVAYLQRGGARGVLVPTMGALHEGHARLVAHGARIAAERTGAGGGGCVVSIFVNPTQFNDPGDLARYPRTLDADLALCASAGAAAVYAPAVEDIYPPGVTIPTPPLPPVATQPGLEDAHRPGHFAGVCQVVRRLFDLCQPAAAVFGEKDWQQLAVVRAMVAQGGGPVIIATPTVRTPSGLAMSSRNRFLTPDETGRAAAISAALGRAAAIDDPAVSERSLRESLAGAGLAIEYAVLRDAATLLPPPRRGAGRLLVAARLGAVRLIDNTPW